MTTALITGASTGIGAAFARRLAADGLDVVLVARSEHRLEELASAIRLETSAEVTVLPRDLGAPGAAEELVAECARRALTIDFLLNNAGFGTHGHVVDGDPDRYADEIQLNCIALTELTTRILPAMVERRHGTIINVASNAAFQPLPQMAVYGATKAYVLSFTEAVWHETRGTGVRILALCPGPTDTPFFDVSGERIGGTLRTTDQLIATTKRALARNEPSVVDGVTNAVGARLGARLLPKKLVMWGAEKVVSPR